MTTSILIKSLDSTLNNLRNKIEEYIDIDKIIDFDLGAYLLYCQHIAIGYSVATHVLKRQGITDFIQVTSDDPILFLKNICKNRPIDNKPFVFLISEFQACQQSMRRLIDSSISFSIFIFVTSKLTNIESGLRSRCTFVNIYKVKKELCMSESWVRKCLKDFFVKVDSLNSLELITDARDIAYKLYHINFPLAQLCKIIIDIYQQHPNLISIVNLCAITEEKQNLIYKDILLYEALILKVAKMFKYSDCESIKKTVTTKKKITIRLI